ncbi:RNA-directed DNA polymerase [Bacillus cereus]|nr:RNA-directed DNA polymerase [Bacillus cereus]MEC3173684.1 RNA-directed DNA polymerase [Bacillus cereus]
MRENLFLRTDVLPEEIPILFSNKNVYSNFSKQDIRKMFKLEESIKNLNKNSRFDSLNSYITVPHNFYIPKNERAFRKISLLHPIAQLQTFSYILRYDQLIASFCKQSKFSVRSPVLRNHPVFDYTKSVKSRWRRMDEEFSFSKMTTTTTDEDEKYFYSYFSYKQYKRIQHLYDSNKFNRDKYKFQYFMKFDIQNFFPSIYTHALAWGIFGDRAIAKRLKGVTDAFGNATDKISQKINFNETNGIIVGPEFSRVMAELLLTRIDINIKEELSKREIVFQKDYALYRYIDDFFLFVHNKEVAYLIEKVIEEELDKYNLKLNTSKTELQEKPFKMVDGSIVELKNAIGLFQFNHLRYLNSKIPVKDYSTWLKSIWNDLFRNIELLVSKYPTSKDRIVNYFLKRVRSLVPSPNEVNKYNLAYILEIISNIYTLSIDSKSTNYIIAIYLKVLQEFKKNMNDNSLNLLHIQEDYTYINEKIFQHLYVILRNNQEDIDQMFDLFIYIRTLDKKLSSSFLCKIIEKYKDSYFVLCSIAYYILEDNRQRTLDTYKTVQKKLKSVVFYKINNYKSKGASNILLEAEYFYLVNDFSFYPGFFESDRQKLKRKIKNEMKKFDFNNQVSSQIRVANLRDTLEKMKQKQKYLFEKITIHSYYDWQQTTETFLREVAKKSINLPNLKDDMGY